MKLHNKLILALSASTLLAGAVSATQLDYRHEYKEDGSQSDRVKMGDGWKINDKWKTNVSFEIKFVSEDKEDALDRTYLTGAEVDMGLTYKINNNWVIKPGMPVYIDKDENTFKPQLRLEHQSDFGLKSGLRVRYEIHNYVAAAYDKNGDLVDNVKTDMDGNIVKHEHRLKITYTGAYKIKPLPNLKVSWEANYVESLDDVKLYDNDNWQYDYGVTIGYQLGKFRPYGEIWNTQESSSTDKRQAKYRIGLKYSF